MNSFTWIKWILTCFKIDFSVKTMLFYIPFLPLISPGWVVQNILNNNLYKIKALSNAHSEANSLITEQKLIQFSSLSNYSQKCDLSKSGGWLCKSFP